MYDDLDWQNLLHQADSLLYHAYWGLFSQNKSEESKQALKRVRKGIADTLELGIRTRNKDHKSRSKKPRFRLIIEE